MGKTKKGKNKGNILVDDHVLLSDISDTEIAILKPMSIQADLLAFISSLSKESAICPDNSESQYIYMYTAVPLYDTRGIKFSTSGVTNLYSTLSL